jgi:hypothetical protein
MEEPMTSITIPGVLVAPLREGAFAVSCDVAEAIDQGEGLRACRWRLAGVCRLLDAIGWTEEDPARDVEVDLCVNAATLRAAVAIMLPLLHAGERELYKALRGFASAELPAMPCVLEIPGEVVVLLRSVLRVQVALVAEDLAAECSLQAPADVTGMLARFDVLRAALEAIGWRERERQQPVEIDFALYGQTIVNVLEENLDFWLSIADSDDYEVSEREHATTTAALIERFLAGLKGGR